MVSLYYKTCIFIPHNIASLCSPTTLQVLKSEVELMAKMAKTIDSFTQNQTRLVVIIDGLDSCEQDKVLQMLDTVRNSSLEHLSACTGLCSVACSQKDDSISILFQIE